MTRNLGAVAVAVISIHFVACAPLGSEEPESRIDPVDSKADEAHENQSSKQGARSRVDADWSIPAELEGTDFISVVCCDRSTDFPCYRVTLFPDGRFVLDRDSKRGDFDGTVSPGLFRRTIQDARTFGFFEFDALLHLDGLPHPDDALTISIDGESRTVEYTPLLDSYRREQAGDLGDRFLFQLVTTYLLGQRVLDCTGHDLR